MPFSVLTVACHGAIKIKGAYLIADHPDAVSYLLDTRARDPEVQEINCIEGESESLYEFVLGIGPNTKGAKPNTQTRVNIQLDGKWTPYTKVDRWSTYLCLVRKGPEWKMVWSPEDEV